MIDGTQWNICTYVHILREESKIEKEL